MRVLRPSWCLLLGSLLSSLTVGSAGAGHAGEAPEIRVLLYDAAEPVRVGSLRSPRTIQLKGAHQLAIEGVGRGSRWHPEMCEL